MTIQNESAYVHDLVAWETDSEFCRDSAVIRNALGAAVDLASALGQPLSYVSAGVYRLITATEAGTPSNIDAICISNKALALSNNTNSTEKFNIMLRGPARLVKDYFAADDGLGYAFTADDIEAGLLELNIQSVSLGSVKGEQTY